jgi:osmotically-inducible protein OsmY
MVEPASEPTPYLVARIREALAHDVRVAALDIGVRVVGHDVFLTGSVTTDARRRSCLAVVQQVVPDHTVHCQLAVLDQDAPGAPEALA